MQLSIYKNEDNYMVKRYTNVKYLGKGIIAFDTIKNIWLITLNDIGYKPTCEWLRNLEFSTKVHHHLIGDSRQEVLEKFAKTL